jgi:TRAP-type C4-dicarboxylate transport system permease small subunit
MSKFIRVLENVVGLILGVMAMLVIYQVLARYVLGDPPSWTEELARYLQVWLVLLAAPICLYRGMHLAVDYLTPKLPPTPQRFVRTGIHLLVGCFCLVFTFFGIKLMKVAALQVSPALRISMIWPYLAIPVSGLAMIGVTVMLLLRGQANESAGDKGA